ncbi:hypothetical protein AC249_AIPGENE19009 [Exaiptasia diaphana]|nr:hypothetical protein AC249_AIPGENE19009 [Exaiptasia diaphana]
MGPLADVPDGPQGYLGMGKTCSVGQGQGKVRKCPRWSTRGIGDGKDTCRLERRHGKRECRGTNTHTITSSKNENLKKAWKVDINPYFTGEKELERISFYNTGKQVRY